MESRSYNSYCNRAYIAHYIPRWLYNAWGWYRCNFKVDIFRCIFVNEKCCIFIKFSLMFVPNGPYYWQKTSLVQIIACRLFGATRFTHAYMPYNGEMSQLIESRIEWLSFFRRHIQILTWVARRLKSPATVWVFFQLVQHYTDVIMSEVASQITSLASVYSTVKLGVDQRKHQSSASLAFVRGIHRRPVNSSHKGPVTRKMFPFDDVIMR